MKDSRKLALRAGVFLTAGFLVVALIIVAIGEKRGLFDRKVTLFANFENTGGLVAGASVRLAGLDVGTVETIEFPDAVGRKEARVELSVSARFLPRIRHDSQAAIDSKGLLGDKIINVTLGSAESPPHVDGDTLATKTGPSMDDLAKKLDEALSSIAAVGRSADTAIRALATEQVRADVARIAAATADLLEQAESGDGVLHRLFYDPKWADEVGVAIAGTRGTITNLEAATGRVDRILLEVEQGKGAAHELVYGRAAADALENLQKATADLASVIGEVRDGQGLLHALIYDEEQAHAVHELTEMAMRLNRMAGELEKGRGTLGGLLVDPSVYEDLKTILGNVERNVLLKALIRFTIKRGDIERPAGLAREVRGADATDSVPEPPPPAANAAPRANP